MFKQYGLIGYPLTHSKSPEWFEQYFALNGIKNASYQLFPLKSIQEFDRLIRNPQLCGLNVTIPYKQLVIPYLNTLSEEAQFVGAVNCIEIHRNSLNIPKLIGHNTDVIGFEESLKPVLPQVPIKALIFGNGGASLAVQFVLNKLKIPFLVVQRKKGDLHYSNLSLNDLQSHHLWINTTPVGMFPAVNEVLPISFSAISANHIGYDLVYNPENTRFLEEIKARGGKVVGGMRMLETQALAATRIWKIKA